MEVGGKTVIGDDDSRDQERKRGERGNKTQLVVAKKLKKELMDWRKWKEGVGRRGGWEYEEDEARKYENNPLKESEVSKNSIALMNLENQR